MQENPQQTHHRVFREDAGPFSVIAPQGERIGSADTEDAAWEIAFRSELRELSDEFSEGALQALLAVRQINYRACKLLRERVAEMLSHRIEGEEPSSLQALCKVWESLGGDRVGMSHEESLAFCNEAIHRELGTLSDLPRELGNTAANIYYHFFELAAECCKNRPPLSVWKGGVSQLAQGLERYGKEVAACLAKLQCLLEMVPSLRELSGDGHAREYMVGVELALDVLKYNIEHAALMPRFLRRLQRKSKRTETEREFSPEERIVLLLDPA